MALYVASRDAETEALSRRAVKTAISACLSYGLSPTLAGYVNGSEILAAVAIMAFAILVLDVLTALVSDRQFVTGLIERRLGLKDRRDE